MSKHEFYADPTLFDHWQNAVGKLLCTTGGSIRPYSWVIGFATLGASLGAIAIVLVGISMPLTVADLDVRWNQALARGITTVVALTAAYWLFRQALATWPQNVELPVELRGLARYVGWRPALVCRPQERRTMRKTSPVVDQVEVQSFFTDVRAAGINVTIARALLAAGICSTRRLRATTDQELDAIHGVGPATVRKLRARFG